MMRVAPTITSFTLVVDAEYRGNAQTMAAIGEAAALATAAAEGRVTFTVADAAAGARITVTTAEQHPAGIPAAAFADRTLNASGYITGGSIVVVDRKFVTGGYSHTDTVQLYAHELGHMLGLHHSTAPGVMSVVDGVAAGFFYFRAHGDYSPAEKLVLRLMAGRRAGNRFPDNDRTAASQSVRSQRIVCGGGV